MADNEKLDNQRLKNFKNKGRDLEVAAPSWVCRQRPCASGQGRGRLGREAGLGGPRGRRAGPPPLPPPLPPPPPVASLLICGGGAACWAFLASSPLRQPREDGVGFLSSSSSSRGTRRPLGTTALGGPRPGLSPLACCAGAATFSYAMAAS